MSLKVVTFKGSPYEMGTAHGEAFRDGVHELTEERIRLSRQYAQDAGIPLTREACLAIAGEHLAVHRDHTPRAYEELRGIAAGAQISPEALLVGNGYTDVRDVLIQRTLMAPDPPVAAAQECTVFAVGGDATEGGGAIIGQNWDMHPTAEPHMILQKRFPENGPAALVVTTAGCLPLIGLNEAGIGLGNSNLVPTDARPGVIYLALIGGALEQVTLDAATRAITRPPRASGHNYYLTDGARVCDIETTATLHDIHEPHDPIYVHANHYLASRLRPLEDPTYDPASSHERLGRLNARLRETPKPLDVEKLHDCMADHEGTVATVCQHDSEVTFGKTCGTVIMSPGTGELWAASDNPCAHRLTRYTLN